MKIQKSYRIFSNYLPLQTWTLEICNHDISKNITARSFKLGQQIEDGKFIYWGIFFKRVIFFELSPLAYLDFENL